MRIEALAKADAEAVAALLRDPGDADGRFFDGLPREADALREILSAAWKDQFWGLWVAGRLAGIFMLRGFDAGFAAPAFGVLIGSEFRGRGLARLALQYCETWCRLGGVTELMLTVSPENFAAVALYESGGFFSTGELSAKGNPIYRKRLGA